MTDEEIKRFDEASNHPYECRCELCKEWWAQVPPEDDECPECGGEGYITAECFEDTCCCADPDEEHGLIACPLCRAGGSRE